MKTVRITFRRGRGWLVTVIGILGIIGGARQQVWASRIQPTETIECRATAESTDVLQ